VPVADGAVADCGKWALLALAALEPGPQRFGMLRQRIEGVSRKMLAQTLRNLERDGLVTRTPHDESPLRVDYALTPLGRELLPRALALKAWAEGAFREIEAANARFAGRQG
jgi:DNA-binding HxlR family transcriptional regulator